MDSTICIYWNTGTAAASLLRMFDAPEALVRDLLRWVAAEPRRYDEALECWRTSCPRLPVWEDAFAAGLIARRPGRDVMMLELTPEGRSYLSSGCP
jgi:D-3-phosphoglycerate dehydrogenase